MNYIEQEARKLWMRHQLINSTIVKVVGQGCQAMNEIMWVGKVTKIVDDTVHMQIMIRNYSYGDARGKEEPEMYTFPLLINYFQNVNGVWVLFD